MGYTKIAMHRKKLQQKADEIGVSKSEFECVFDLLKELGGNKTQESSKPLTKSVS